MHRCGFCQKSCSSVELCSSKDPEKKLAWFPTNILSSTAVFNVVNTIKINNIEYQISILERFLKKHVTKTGVMFVKIQLCITGINYIVK